VNEEEPMKILGHSIIAKLLFVFSMLFVNFGCATIGSLAPGTEKGYKFTIEEKTYDEIWKASIKAVTRNLTIVESNKELGIIKAEKGASLFTWGEVAAVFITPANVESSRYQVEVVCEKRAKAQITGQDWTLNIVEGIKAELDLR
jgi:hypothetical protein